MKKIIKITALVAAFVLIAGCIGFTAAATDESDTLVLFDFADDGMYDESGAYKLTFDGQGTRFLKATDQKLHGEFCAQWKIDGYGSGCIIYPNEAKAEYTGADFTAYNCFNLWLYNDEPTDSDKCFWIVLQSYPNKWANRASVQIKREWTGWKKFTFHFDEFTISGAFDWSRVFAVNLKRASEGGAAGSIDSGYWKRVCFDRIWLTNDSPGYIAFDVRNPYLSKIKTLSGAVAFEKDSSVDGMFGCSARWVKDKTADGPTVFWNNAASPTDLSGFTHINFAVNSSGAGTGSKPRDIRIYGYEGSNWNQYPINSSWTGRQFFSIPLASFTLGGSSASFDWSATKGLRFFTSVQNDNVIHFDRISFSSGAPAEFTAADATIENGAHGIPVKTKTVAIKFTNGISEYTATDAVTVTKNGEPITDFYFASAGKTAEIIFKDDLAVNSEYEITVDKLFDIYGQYIKEPATLAFKTERSEEQKQFVKDVNDATSADEVRTLINNNGFGADFGIDNAGEELAMHTATVIFEQKTYADYDAVIEMSEKAIDVLKKLNECDIVSMSEFLEKNKELVLFGVSEYDYYGQLEPRELNEVNEAFISDEDYPSFAAFRKAFAQAVKDKKNEKENENKNEETTESATPVTTPSGGGGGGGGSKKTTVLTVVPEKKTEENQADETPAAPAEEYFTDLDEVQWVKAAASEMLEKGVLSKDETRLFRPTDNVTRAEFLKMLVTAFNITEDSAQCWFHDVTKDDWYYPYVAAAYGRGIVLGDSANNFGADRFITRQDAAAMAYRAVKALDKYIEEAKSDVSFADASEIAEYAREAVEKMARAEIINGVGNNIFSPKSLTNRAQAVKIVYELIQKTKGAAL